MNGAAVATVVEAFGLGAATTIEPLPLGFMNRNWRVTTPAGTFAVKQVLDAHAEKVSRQHAATAALAERGFPVPLAVPAAGW